MSIIFRCDASFKIGLGHLMRCLSIASFIDKSRNVDFASIEDDSNSLIHQEGYSLFEKKAGKKEDDFIIEIVKTNRPKTLIIDVKYNYSKETIRVLKDIGTKIILLDVVCDGLDESDEIIYPGAFIDLKSISKYVSPVRLGKVKFGPEFIIFRNEIQVLRSLKSKPSYPPKELFITTGGSDPEGVLFVLLRLLNELDLKINITVLVGRSFLNIEKLKEIQDYSKNLLFVPYDESLLLKADIVICTFGVSLYEMIFLNIPTISIAHSKENDVSSGILEQKFNGFINAGYYKNLNSTLLEKHIKALVNDKELFSGLIESCNGLIDGKGAQRIAKLIQSE